MMEITKDRMKSDIYKILKNQAKLWLSEISIITFLDVLYNWDLEKYPSEYIIETLGEMVEEYDNMKKQNIGGRRFYYVG